MQMEEFQKPHVHMKDPDRVEELVTQLIKDGKTKLLVVTDFDRTLSRFKDNDGRKVPTCHGNDMNEWQGVYMLCGHLSIVATCIHLCSPVHCGQVAIMDR